MAPSIIQSLLLIASLVSTSIASSSIPYYRFHESPLLDSNIGDVNATLEAMGDADFFKILNVEAEDATETKRYAYMVGVEDAIPLDGYARIIELNIAGKGWTVHEDISKPSGNLVFAASTGEQRIFPKYAEMWNPPADPKYPRYLGLSIRDVGLALDDVLATQLLKTGEPLEEQVRAMIPSLVRGIAWSSFVGNVHASDVVAVWPQGSTKSFKVDHTMPEMTRGAKTRYDGYLGGWMPAVRKVYAASANDWFETTVFGDVDDKDPFIIPTWHRTIRVTNGKVVKTTFGHSYPTFTRVQGGPKPEAFYTALFRFGDYWNKHLEQRVKFSLPDKSWEDMGTYSFVKELLIRPNGDYPRYGAFDRDYGGSEYSGFQDIFTSSLSANLEWGRFEQAKAVFDNYYTMHTADDGNINMRGPEVGQFGLTLSLIAKYALYTGDVKLLEKHKEKIIATAGVLIRLHEESLALPATNPGYGLLHGWSESDAALKGDPSVWWKPYYGNSALGARGFKDIATIPLFSAQAADWNRRAEMLINRTTESAQKSIFPGTNPPYVPPMPGVTRTFRDDMARGDSEQAWPHRLYAEMLHGNILPEKLANTVVDTIRAYGATSMGVVANVANLPNPGTRDILGFISYGHALSLLFLDRTDEFVLFLFTHRYHVHSRGAWNAGEVTGTAGGQSAYCQPSQATIPILLRWALVLEDQDHERLYLGRGLPRQWLGIGKEISIKGAPTRWGKVDYSIHADKSKGKVTARVKFLGDGTLPVDFEVKMRVPKDMVVKSVSANGKPAQIAGKEGVFIKTEAGVKEYLVEASI